jgi:hypothetical protein
MGFTKIENSDLTNIGVIGLPDRPGLSTAAMQEKLEETSRSVVIPKHNALIDELEATDSASYLGATPLTGRASDSTVQGVMTKLSTDLKTVEDGMAEAIASVHTHLNKALLDSYEQTESDLADAVDKKHEHENKDLLDTYTQTEANLSDAVVKKHSHTNKSLLDTYTQTESDLADAVDKKHEHSNKALLDTYTQTESDLAQAVADDHTHSNKTVLDKFGESSGEPTYDGNPIGGGGSGDTFKNIVSAGTTFTANGQDTFKINAGSNVTITALSSPDKGISISATGGGQSTGDMLMSDYDSQGDVKTAGGIDAYVSAQIGTLDVSDSAVSGKYVSAVSEADGKITVTRENLPSIPTITDTYSALSHDGMSGVAVASAIGGVSVPDELKDLTGDVSITSTPTDGDVLTYETSSSKWKPKAASGHEMVANTPESTLLTAISGATTSNNKVVSAYGIREWSNCAAKSIMATIDTGDDGIGTWEADDTWETSGVRTGWIWSADLYHVIEDGSGNRNLDVELEPIFDVGDSEVVSIYAIRIDDNVSNSGTNGGAIAIKLNGKVQSAGGVTVGVRLIYQRTERSSATILS